MPALTYKKFHYNEKPRRMKAHTNNSPQREKFTRTKTHIGKVHTNRSSQGQRPTQTKAHIDKAHKKKVLTGRVYTVHEQSPHGRKNIWTRAHIRNALFNAATTDASQTAVIAFEDHPLNFISN